MWVVRAVRIEDLDALFRLAQSATKGLTSLQLDRSRLLDRVEQSNFAFSRTGMSPRGEPYVLVLIDTETDELVGTSTVYAKTGGYQPLYAYRRVESDHRSELLGVEHRRVRLDLERIHDGPTEIGSLFLRGVYRGEGRGRWLSLARFSLISMLPHRFADRVIAQMRGRAESDGSVPFWNAVAGRFIPTEFATADAMSTISKQFIEEMMPQHPIYLDLLADEIREGIGQVHEETEPAVAMLKSEGFVGTDLFDIFDAGPVISCETESINAVQRTRTVRVGRVVNEVDPPGERVILSTSSGGFMSVLTKASVDSDTIDVAQAEARQLEVEAGSSCSLLPVKPLG
ncbi:MAG: arginine N-succinyltransferase [Rubripirellula sp.]